MLKISGESLAGSNEQGFDFENLNDLSNSIKKLQSKNQIVPITKSTITLLYTDILFVLARK